MAEKLVTLGKTGTLHHRRLISARLHQDEVACRILFKELAPTFKSRPGGYTRIIQMDQRQGDAAQLAILEWVELPVDVVPAETKPEDVKAEEVKSEKQ